jgi:hypothetical protein
VRVAMVLVAPHEPRAEEQRHGLLQRELERRQERGLLGAVACPVLPDRDSDFFLQRAQVAVDRAHVHTDAVANLLRRQAVRVLEQQVRDSEQASGPVALDEFLGAVHGCFAFLERPGWLAAGLPRLDNSGGAHSRPDMSRP